MGHGWGLVIAPIGQLHDFFLCTERLFPDTMADSTSADIVCSGLSMGKIFFLLL
jgi:hypothetical protein